MSMVLFSFLSVFEQSINVGVLTNIIIAIATVVATAIHFDSQRKLRKDRIWDINKDLLLDLAFSLSEAIKATKIEIGNLRRNLRYDEEEEVNSNSFSDISKKIDYALNVYRPLMNNELVRCCENFQNEEQKIAKQVNSNVIGDEEAYEMLLKEYEVTYKAIQDFIFIISGVKNI